MKREEYTRWVGGGCLDVWERCGFESKVWKKIIEISLFMPDEIVIRTIPMFLCVSTRLGSYT